MQPGKRFRIGVLPALFFSLALLLAACGGSTSTTPSNTTSGKAPADKQVYRMPIIGDIATFDPALVEDTDSNFPIQSVFTGLVQLDDKLNVQPQIASSWDTSKDGLTWTFHLRDGLKFSDGTPLTSKDVAYSINRTLAPATKSTVAGYLSLIKDFDKVTKGTIPTVVNDSIKTPDDKTVVITLSAPGAYFLKQLTYPTSYIVEKSLIDKYGTQWTDHLTEGGGAGPWKVQTYSHTKGIDLVPNTNYYGPKPQLSKLSWTFFPTTNAVNTMYSAYKASQIDYTPIPAANVPDELSNKEYIGSPRLTISYITMNYLVKPFDNIKIRQAFALAINKDALAKSVNKNTVIPSNHVIPQGMPGYFDALTGPSGVTATGGDNAKAKQLFQDGLKEAGYNIVDKLPTVTVTFVNSSAATTNSVSAMQQMWKTALGVDIKTQPVARAKALTLESAAKGNANGLQMWVAGWNADYSDPQDWLSVFFGKGADYNQFNYGQNNSPAAADQQAVQAQLAQADVEQDATKRLQMYNTAEQKIVNDVGWAPLWQQKLHRLIKPNVKGFVLNTVEIIPPNSWANIYISQ